MELTWLNTFITAAKEGNFRRTADRLHLAQSTVTLHIQNIETLVNAKLFDRVGRNVKLNSTGLGFLQYAKAIVETYGESLEYVARALQGYQETIKISVSTLVATTRLPMWIREFRRIHPEVEFSIKVTDSAQVLDDIRKQECDIGIGRMPILSEQLQCIDLYDDPIVLAIPRETPETNKGALNITELFKKYLLFTNNHPLYWDDLLSQLRKVIPSIRTMKVSKVHVSVEWIKEGMGVSFLPLSTVKRDLEQANIQLTPFSYFPLPSAHTYLVTQKRPNKVINTFIDLASTSV